MLKKKDVLFTTLGAAITSFAVSVLLAPNKIVCGGASGLSTILYQTLSVPPGLTLAVFNALLLLAGIRILGKQFIVKTLFGAGMLSVFVQLFSYIPPLTDNIILASVFGGVLYGVGIGIVFAMGATTGGTDILGRLIQHKFSRFPVGKLLLIVDGLIILLALISFKNVELVLFGIITLFLSTYTIDWLIRRLNISKMAFVITEHGEDISELLISTSTRGVTVINAIGAYSAQKKSILFCALKEREITDFQKKILEQDANAFIVYSEAQQIKGKGFHIYT